MRRAVVTGLGLVTPVGIGREEFWEGLLGGRSATRLVRAFDPASYRSQMAAEVTDFDPGRYFDLRRFKRLDRFSQFSLAAARLALNDAALDPSSEDPGRVGVCMGSALGGIRFAEEQVEVFRTQGYRAIDPALALSVFCGAGSCNIAIDIGATGPVTANSNSCAAGTIAIGEALGFIREGAADVVLAGGAEAPVAPLCFGAFAAIRAMSCRNDEPERASRPFDAERDGFVMGEGAAMLVVEEMEHALKRGAHIHCELSGRSLTNDAFHMAAPRQDGASAAQAMRLALADAGAAPRDVDYINAHGSSTPLNDRTETLAIKSVFGERAYRIPISGTKGHHGHALGATGAMEAAACALAIERNLIPPTINLDIPDPECDLDYTPCTGRQCQVDTVLSNSFGFGGINACLVMNRPRF